MEFVDEVVIFVRSGRGGDGAVSFRRERNLPFGGPDGGDGGRGGSVRLHATENADTLLPLARTQQYIARSGEPGSGHARHGASAEDLRISVPVGTVVHELARGEAGTLSERPPVVDPSRAARLSVLVDLDAPEAEATVAAGGAGGQGNRHFATAENQAPRESTPGGEGEEAWLHLELKLIADVGLLGFPNAGKSTLLSRLSAARPRIAGYPFTTLQPHLGIVSDGYGHELVLADIPGLIEGAADGAGLGMQFLRHVERCRILLHLVDLSPVDGTYPWEHVRAIERELARWSPALAERPQLLVGNKMDLTGAAEALELMQDELARPAIGISAVTGEGLPGLRQQLFQLIRQHPRSGSASESGHR